MTGPVEAGRQTREVLRGVDIREHAGITGLQQKRLVTVRENNRARAVVAGTAAEFREKRAQKTDGVTPLAVAAGHDERMTGERSADSHQRCGPEEGFVGERHQTGIPAILGVDRLGERTAHALLRSPRTNHAHPGETRAESVLRVRRPNHQQRIVHGTGEERQRSREHGFPAGQFCQPFVGAESTGAAGGKQDAPEPHGSGLHDRAAAQCDQFGEDRDRDLQRLFAADRQTDRGVQPGDLGCVEVERREPLAPFRGGAR